MLYVHMSVCLYIPTNELKLMLYVHMYVCLYIYLPMS